MNTKNNQRTRLSKLLFKNALMDLLKEKGSVAKISVRELCDRAELNRSTFYAHYNEPNDLLTEIENEILQSTEEHLRKIGEENDAGAHKYLHSFLKYIRENDKIFRTPTPIFALALCNNRSFSLLTICELSFQRSLNNTFFHIYSTEIQELSFNGCAVTILLTKQK